MANKTLKRLVIALWLINLFVCMSLVGLWMFSGRSLGGVLAFFMPPTATTTPTFTPTASSTFSVTPSSVPTKTPEPSATSSPAPTNTPTTTPTITNTPIPFHEGPFPIGTSVQGRPLEVHRFGTGETERMIVAGMHGGSEYNTIQLADQLITYLLDHPETIPDSVTLYILRNLNPDGEAVSHSFTGRPNANNVDLNRNWDANWQKEWPRQNCWTYTFVTGGPAPSSEPETQALMQFLLAHHISALINYHSAALGIFAGGLPAEASTLGFASAVAEVSTYPYPPVNVGCIYTGGFTDWADENGIPALDVELTNHTDTDFEMNLNVLTVLLEWSP